MRVVLHCFKECDAGKNGVQILCSSLTPFHSEQKSRTRCSLVSLILSQPATNSTHCSKSSERECTFCLFIPLIAVFCCTHFLRTKPQWSVIFFCVPFQSQISSRSWQKEEEMSLFLSLNEELLCIKHQRFTSHVLSQ